MFPPGAFYFVFGRCLKTQDFSFHAVLHVFMFVPCLSCHHELPIYEPIPVQLVPADTCPQESLQIHVRRNPCRFMSVGEAIYSTTNPSIGFNATAIWSQKRDVASCVSRRVRSGWLAPRVVAVFPAPRTPPASPPRSSLVYVTSQHDEIATAVLDSCVSLCWKLCLSDTLRAPHGASQARCKQCLRCR